MYEDLRRVQGRMREPLSIHSYIHGDAEPGDYWLMLTSEGDRPLNVRDNPEDREAWEGSRTEGTDNRYASNLTGLVLAVKDPLGHYGMLSIHTVRREEDGTCSVRNGDGSSNSILIKRRDDEPYWHGYIEHGVWVGEVQGPDVPPAV